MQRTLLLKQRLLIRREDLHGTKLKQTTQHKGCSKERGAAPALNLQGQPDAGTPV